MSFLFASSHLPETRVQRPEDEEEDDVQPMLHSGGVRAFSHLPAKRMAADPAGPLSQRGAQALGRPFQRTGSETPGTRPEDGISAAKASGVFDVVRQQFNRDDSPHFMDEDGNLRPRDEAPQQAPQQAPPAPRDPRSPQFGAGAPPRPAWSTGHAAAADSSRSPRTSSSASDDTRPWYMPPITPEDLDPQHFDDDYAAGAHSAPKGRPEVHDLVYRTPGASTPKPEFNDLVYRFNGSAEEAKEHNKGYFQNAAAAAEAGSHYGQQAKTYGAPPAPRSNNSSLGFASQPTATGPNTDISAQDSIDRAKKRYNPELEAAKQEVETRLAEQRKVAEQADNARYVLEQNQENIKSLEELRLVLKAAKKGYEIGKKRLPIPKKLKKWLDIIMKESGADPAAQIKNLDAKINDSKGRTEENEKSVKEAEAELARAIEKTQKAAQRMKLIEQIQSQDSHSARG